MKKGILLGLTLSFMIIAIASCSMENATGDPVVITHNPKNLLLLEKSDYSYYSSFPKREVFMSFTTPQDFGATSYTLQFSHSNAPYNFEIIPNGSGDYTTEDPQTIAYDLPIPSSHTDGYFRLLINGGSYDGNYSNIVYATQCAVDVYITWSLDYSMVNTGTMFPHVRFGIVASFSVVPDDITILNSLTYEWFRVNPNDFEDRELIVGQTDLSYTTQLADIDHYILVEATGSDVNFNGGFCYAMTDFVITL